MSSRTALALAGLGLALLSVLLWFVLGQDATPGAAAESHGRTLAAEAAARPLAAPSARVPEDDAPARADAGGAPAAGLAGRVVDAEDGSGLEGFWASLHPDARPPDPDVAPLEEARTDAAGTFRFEREPSPQGWVRVEPEHGWQLERDGLPATADPLVFRARRARRAPFRALLVDALTGEPVPHFLLGLNTLPDWTRLEVISDADGRCATEFDLEEGELALDPVDHPRLRRAQRSRAQSRRVRHEGLAGAVGAPLEVAVGPSYWLDLSLPPDLAPTSLHALLVEHELDSFDRDDDFARAPLRLDPADGAPWVRFGPFTPPMVRRAQGGTLLLVVRDEACTHRGVTRVRARLGVYPDLVRVDLEPMGHAAITLLDATGAAIPGVEALLYRAGDPPPIAEETTTNEGRAWFRGLPPGTYRLRAFHRRFETLEADLAVAAGLESARTLRMLGAPTSGAVAGRVVAGPRWRARRRAGSMEVSLWEVGGTRHFGAGLSFEQEGPERWVAAFRFEDVPAGRYTCSLNGYDPSAWWPQRIEVAPPRRDLEFAEITEAQTVFLLLDVRDAETGGPVEGAMMYFEQPGARPRTWSANRRSGATVHRDVDLEWGLGAPGFVPRFGDRRDLRLVGDRLGATIELERGFGVRLEARGTGGAPIVGARVLLDGRAAGETGPDGRLTVRSAAPPEELRVELVDGSVGSPTGGRVERAIERGWPHVTVYPGVR